MSRCNIAASPLSITYSEEQHSVNNDGITDGFHDPLGLLPYASWLGGHGFIVSLLLCLALAPGAMMVIAPIFESRWLPLGKDQFNGFFPGTVFLAIGTAILLSITTGFDHEAHWYTSTWWHVSVQACTLVGAVLVTVGDRKTYPRRALFSPTKLYNNAMYAFYGYVVITTFVTEMIGAGWHPWTGLKQAIAWVLIYMWLKRVRKDGNAKPEVIAALAKSAHVADWQPCWRKTEADAA